MDSRFSRTISFALSLSLSCAVCLDVHAQAATDPGAASVSPSAPPVREATTPEAGADATRAAVPVDHAALEALSEQTVLDKPTHRDWENDPLFYPGVALVGTGAAALLASLLTGLGAHSIYTSLEDACTNNVCTRNLGDRIDSGKTLATISTVLTGVGVGAAALGTVFLVVAAGREDDAPPDASTSLRFSLSNGPTPWGLAGTLRF